MQILSHRGLWENVEQQNTIEGFKRSFEGGFGIETDIRDRNEKLVIAHDLPNEISLNFSNFLTLASKTQPFLALNIKSDGLAELLKEKMANYSIEKWMVFDMSIPDLIQHLKVGNPVFTRVSEIEVSPSCLNDAQGIWLDAFYEDWYSSNQIETYLKIGKKVCVVSPELHKRDKTYLWKMLKESNLYKEKNMLLCTDFPKIAQNYFQL